MAVFYKGVVELLYLVTKLVAIFRALVHLKRKLGQKLLMLLT